MPVKVRVQNFQSIKEAEIEVKGLTSISGPNNSGKSALMRAIRGVFQNTPGTSFIRKGTDECRVELEFEDGRKVGWEKGTKKSKKPTYILNGDTANPIYPGKEIPEPIRELGVVPIQAGGNEIWPTLAPQITGQVFLLDGPGSGLAEAVADVERVTQLNKAMRLADSDKRSVQATLKVRRQDAQTHEAELASFDGLDETLRKRDEIVRGRDHALRIQTAHTNIIRLRDRWRSARARTDALVGIEALALPNPEEARSLLKQLRALEPLRARWVSTKAKVATLAGVETVVLPDPEKAKAPLRELRALEPLRDRLRAAVAEVEALAGVERVSVPDHAEPGRVLADLQALEALQDRLRASRAKVAAFSGIESIRVQDVDSKQPGRLEQALGVMKTLRDRLEATQALCEGRERELEKAQLALTTMEAELAQAKAELGDCPTCGQPFDLGQGSEMASGRPQDPVDHVHAEVT